MNYVYIYIWLCNLPKQFIKTTMTIWFVVLFFKCAFVQLFQTKCAHKMFRMKFLEHCRYTATSYRFGATGTQWSTFCMVMGFAIRQSFVVEKWTALEGLTAILQHWVKNKAISIVTIEVWIKLVITTRKQWIYDNN